jgi:hypothetical protein
MEYPQDPNRREVSPDIKPGLLKDIQPIEHTRGVLFLNREQIHELVEWPLVSACEEFFDKRILTVSSSANAKDLHNGHAHIILDYDSLSDENKEVALRHGSLGQDGGTVLIIEIPVGPETTAEEIKTRAEAIAHEFKKQKTLWIPSYTVEQMRQAYGIDPDDEQYPAEAFTTEGWYFDPVQKLLFRSKEHSQMFQE